MIIAFKATGHNDHCMINIGGQRPKIGGNWPSIGPYLHRCKHALSSLEKISNTDFEERLVHQCGFLVLNDTPPLRIYKEVMAVKILILEL